MPGQRFTKMNKKNVAKPSTSSSNNQQKTLFQSWGSKVSSGPSVSSAKTSGTVNNADQFQPSPDCADNGMDSEDEDELLMQALEQTTNLSREIGTTTFELQEDVPEIDLSLIPDLPGFDKSAGLKWIYPTNYPVRAYQFDIVKSALFQNTIVALPTGLGKTFIAAVLMFNFYRWYPLGKIVFMAPTKPLVTQQIEACYNIMGIPQSDMVEMTGKMFPAAREKAWKEKRVIFLTPQVLNNDLSRGTCQAERIKCLVVDEAHKSLGNYAYCLVVRELVKINRDFRVLALSATPGSNLTMVQEVISNLLISNIELRTDDSPEIKIYSFERKVEKIIVPMGEELGNVEKQYLQLLETVVNRLVQQKVCYKRNVKSLSTFLMLQCRAEFRQNPPSNIQQSQRGVIEGDFALAMSLYHGYELLQLHGLRSFYQYLLSLINGEKGYGRTRTELMKNGNFISVYDYLTNKFGEKPSITFTQQTSQEKAEQYVIGHPKLEKLQEIVIEHFLKFQKDDGSSDTRVMIFSQYRNSVTDITEMLKRQQPLVKVMSFMGQAVKKDAKCFTQKEQLKVMKAFREGNFNTLVSTCVGEEGLDIGDVDLIICFDASKSPIRLVQRMGRTGRKRDGRIVMLVTEGKEDQIYKQGQYNKTSINKALKNGTKKLHYYQESPRMLPDGLVPQCHKMYITIKNEFETLDEAKAKKIAEKKEEQKEKKAKMTKAKTKPKAKTKTIIDLLTQPEHSMNGRLTPTSKSNSPISNTEFQPIDENSDLLTRLNIGNGIGSSSPSNYKLLSDDDELPDLSHSPPLPPLRKTVSRSKKAACDKNGQEKPNSKATKRKAASKENPKRKKGSKKIEEPKIDAFIVIQDNDSGSDFMEEREPHCENPLLDENGGFRVLFKSQVGNSGQEQLNTSKSANPPKSANPSESPISSLSKNSPVINCLVPEAPSLENIPDLLDDLEAQDSLRHSPDLSHLSLKWDEEFNGLIKQADVSSSSESEKTDPNFPAASSATLSSSSVAVNNNNTFCHISPEKEDIDVSGKNDSRDLVEPMVTVESPKKNSRSSNISSPDLSTSNDRKRQLSSEANFETAVSATLASSSVAKNNDEGFCDLSPEREDIDVNDRDNPQSPDLVVPMVDTVESPQPTSPMSNIFSQEFSSANSSSHRHRKRKLTSDSVGSSKLRKHQRLKSSEEETDEKDQSIPFCDDHQSATKTPKSKFFTEPVEDDSELVTSYGDLFADVSLDDTAEQIGNNCSSLEKSGAKLPESEKQKLEISDLQVSKASDNVFDEENPYEDDHPVFDLTTDMFSEDDLTENFELELDSVKTPASDRKNCVSELSSEKNPSRALDRSSSPVSLGKSSSSSKLSNLIVSFVNTKFSTVGKGDVDKNDDDNSDVPLFDLGLDFDALPPTPVRDNSNSRPTSSKAFHSNLECSTPLSRQNKSVSTLSETRPRTEGETSAVPDNAFSSTSEEEDELGGFRLVLPALHVIQSQSTPFRKEKAISEELFSPYLDLETNDASPLHEKEDVVSPSSMASQGFDLQFDDFLDDDLDGCEVSVQPETVQNSTGNKEFPIDLDNMSEGSSDDSFVAQKTRKKCAVLKSQSTPSSHQEKSTSSTNPTETMDEDDDSFCIRKKKMKTVMILSQNEGHTSDAHLNVSPSPKLRRKRITFQLDETNSQDDFVEANQSLRRLPSISKTKSGDKNRRSRHLAKRGDASDGRQFLDEEAEQSGSDDDGLEEIEEEEDHYEQSFINDFSQADQTQNTVDMRAVYLQSVVSPVANPHGYKLKYGKPNMSNVYSCAPGSDDEYEQDSFCVDSEEEEEQESSLTEYSTIEDSLLERKPPKRKNKNTNDGKPSTKRRVIRPESSSEEEIFQDPNGEAPANVPDCDKVQQPVELDLNVKRNEPKSKPGSSSSIVTENIDCDESEPLVIYADSREISGAQDIISDLRIEHKVKVVVTKLEACDYVLSLRTAVERKVMSDFANGANSKKLVKRLQDMCEYFDRPCLIIEKNPLKGHDKRSVPRPIPQTKYLETLLSQLSLSPIRVLFSDTKSETCALLASLCFQEDAKGVAVCRNQVLSDPEQQKLKFFLTLPKVNHALAMNMCRNYKNIKEFLQSSVSSIVAHSKMSSERALYIYKFVREQLR